MPTGNLKVAKESEMTRKFHEKSNPERQKADQWLPGSGDGSRNRQEGVQRNFFGVTEMF